jgi:subtilase family serine protease
LIFVASHCHNGNPSQHVVGTTPQYFKEKAVMQRLTYAFLATVAVLFAAGLPGTAQAPSVLTHHVREAVLNGQAPPVGRLSSEKVLQLDVVLPLRDRQGLKWFLEDLYNPDSASYRHFLTPAEFTARFGPTQKDYDTVVRWARANGFKVVGGTRDGMDVQIRGPVSAIESAFHVVMRTYQHPTEGRTFYGPDREPVTSLPFALWHVSGLDNFSIPHPMFVKKSDYARAHGIRPEDVVKHATTGSGPSASFLGSDMRAAYYGGTALTGAGQNLGLFEYEGTDLADFNTYYKNVNQTAGITPVLLSTDGTSTSCTAASGCDDTEQTLDMTQALGMAPGLSSMVVYIGSTDTAIISAMTTHNPLPTTIGCSWGWTPADPSTLDPYFEKMAAQGQNFFAASGDSSTWSSRNEAWPADDANIVSVGGTDLTTSSAAGPWASETAWSDSGGGISPDGIAIPSWQQLSGVIDSSNRGSTTLRNGPDVAANANFTFYVCADQTTCTANEYGGTSFAAPMWAGYVALVNQQLAENGQPTIGFINPTLYSQNVTSEYGTDFHDITSGTSGSYSAVTGYDLVTGWGSPNGTGLINALAGGSSTQPGFSLSASPGSVSIAQGGSGSSTITSTVTGGFDFAVSLSASGQPSGVSVGFSPGSITGTGTSTMSITVASTVAAGTYAITVTGTSGSTAHTTSVSLTVTSAGGTGTFTISVSPSSGYLLRGQSGYAVVSTTVSGGFSAPITLSASGIPSGVTGSFSPNPIAAPGSGTSDFTLTVARNAPTGTHVITIKGTGGGVTQTTTLTFTVRR